MVAIRITIQALIAVAAAMSARAYSYADALDALAARSTSQYDGLNARELPTYSTRYVARGFSDDSLSLVARDLAGLGIRSEDISHILVVRMTRPPSPAGLSKSELQTHLAELKPELAKAKANVKAASTALKAAMKAKNAAEEKKQQHKLEDARGMVETYQEYVTHYESELKKHP